MCKFTLQKKKKKKDLIPAGTIATKKGSTENAKEKQTNKRKRHKR